MRRMLTSLRVTFVTKRTSDRLSVSQELFNKYRSCELAFAVFANLGLVASTIDYEVSYSPYRTHNNCLQDSNSMTHRMIAMLTSLMALIFVFLKHFQKEIWIKYQQETEKILNKTRTRPYFSTYAVNEKQSTKIVRIFEIISLCLFPYPYIDADIPIPMRWEFRDLHGCYKLSEIMYAFMFVRIFYLFKALSNYTIYRDHLARRYCTFYRTRANSRFSFKCVIARYPLSVIIICMTIPALVILGLILRIFERPNDDLTGQDYEDPTNAIWVCATFLTLEGFTNFDPASIPAECVIMICFAVGTIIYTLTLLTLWSNINLNDKQEKVFVNIHKTHAAAMLISAGFSYYKLKGKYGEHSLAAVKAREKLDKCVVMFKKNKSEIQEMGENKNNTLGDLTVAVQGIEKKLNRLVEIINQLSIKYENN
ncbi:unnamed protein product [Blepharisma stoltei]|uniref:Odorant receptor n=1 Tax=Blepharisma stoltei TaxID=1481888 RepID=A0AAU9JGE6_9CILI|nr:unnamed protein product [Blepharisma stoltei]